MHVAKIQSNSATSTTTNKFTSASPASTEAYHDEETAPITRFYHERIVLPTHTRGYGRRRVPRIRPKRVLLRPVSNLARHLSILETIAKFLPSKDKRLPMRDIDSCAIDANIGVARPMDPPRNLIIFEHRDQVNLVALVSAVQDIATDSEAQLERQYFVPALPNRRETPR